MSRVFTGFGSMLHMPKGSVTMTEREWNEGDKWSPSHTYMQKMNEYFRVNHSELWSDRKHRLFMSVKARILIFNNCDLQLSPGVLEMVEAVADGKISPENGGRFGKRKQRRSLGMLETRVQTARNSMYDALEVGITGSKGFRTPSRVQHWLSHSHALRILFNPFYKEGGADNPDALRLAQEIYDGNYSLVNILADALEDEGKYKLKDHFRYGECPHYKGCWALDVILKKS